MARKPSRFFCGNELALVIPEIDELLRILFDELDEKGSGHIGKTLAHPLVTIGIEAHHVAPPLVCDFVGRYHLPVSVISKVEPELWRTVVSKNEQMGSHTNVGQDCPKLQAVCCVTASRL